MNGEYSSSVPERDTQFHLFYFRLKIKVRRSSYLGGFNRKSKTKLKGQIVVCDYYSFMLHEVILLINLSIRKP